MNLSSNKILLIIVILHVISGLSLPVLGKTSTTRFNSPQSGTVRYLLRREKRTQVNGELVNIINYIDTTYTLMPQKIQQGKKLVIFVDPAHGRLPNGQWQGGKATRRRSCTGLPEEYYSIKIARKLYKHLSRNRYIQVASTDDFLRVMKGEQDEYRNIPFSTTVKLARQAGAFIIVAEHLNNVSVFNKASGIINLPGIHVTYHKNGKKYLRHVRGTHKGFLTLYNQLDASGFSQAYALKLKSYLKSRGLKANNWNMGAVADDRFSYFHDFPVSVIYESGFISNPVEEKLLKDDKYVSTIAEEQYQALVSTIREKFNIDIESGFTAPMSRANLQSIELLKLSRMSVYYISRAESVKATRIINLMTKKFRGREYRKRIAYYSDLAHRMSKAEGWYRKARYHHRKRHYRTARRYFRRAYRLVQKPQVLEQFRKKYGQYLFRGRRKSGRSYVTLPDLNHTYPVRPGRAPLKRPFILAIEENMSTREALELALDADSKIIGKLEKQLEKLKVSQWKRHYWYSKKHKRRFYRWKKVYRHVKVYKGIYLMKLDKNLNIVQAKRVSSIQLNPDKYQNHQYLKNSYFGSRKQKKAL